MKSGPLVQKLTGGDTEHGVLISLFFF